MSESARAAHAFTRLVDIMATLRGPDGCPWDREQTIDTLKPFVLEEAYEVIEAIDRHDHAALCEELGDFAFEAVFLAQLESEAGHFTIADSLESIADKLVRRHPHVFARDAGEPPLESAGQVRVRWEEIKAREHSSTSSSTETRKPKTLLSGIAPALPALLRAYHIGTRAASVGFDWAAAGDVVDKIQEEVDELREVVKGGGEMDQERAEEEMGDLLFAMANLSRKLGIEPETALRKANDKFTKRFTEMERSIAETGRSLSGMKLEELEEEWQRAKSK
ncbi:MAG TPA: nucleoside triphosphate pyrophosphohydrolase [Vicinamibacterales bacterium]|jgi:MazG family protein|nr:nucleoside triphosphate pyrophosphohydrolase [Vicinamibacterales bacterium]